MGKDKEFEDAEECIEYYVSQASKGMNIAECWQAIHKIVAKEKLEIIESVPKKNNDGRLVNDIKRWQKDQKEKL